MLELREVTKRFGRHTAVDGVRLTLSPGDFLGLIGPNGAGKTTTLKMSVGHLRPTAGAVLIQGKDVNTHPLEARRNIGYVPEYVSLYEYLSGAEYLDFVGEIKGMGASERKKEADALLDLLDLGEERNRLIRTYSQGMRRKVALAGAIIGRPPVLILDEALNGLDPTTNHRLKGFLKGLAAEGTAILLSSHVLEVLERICNRIVVLNRGKLVDARNEAELDKIRRQEGGLEQHFLRLLSDENPQPDDNHAPADDDRTGGGDI